MKTYDDVRRKINEQLAKQAADEHQQFIKDAMRDIEADERSYTQHNSFGSWVEYDPWTVEKYVETYKAKKRLENHGKPTDPLWMRWMLEIMDVEEKNHYRRHSGKPLQKYPKPPKNK